MSGYTFYPAMAAGPKPANRKPALQPAHLFATTIWQVRLAELAPHFPRWVEAVNALRAAAPAPAGRSVRMGWNSVDKKILEQPVFQELGAAIRDGCRSAFEQMGTPNLSFVLESWVNMHDRGGFNFAHIHDGCLLSGAFYLQVPEGSGPLVLRDPRPGVVNSRLKGPGANGHNDVQLRPETGLLVMFPSWLEHFVEPHGSDTPRIAISFNALQE